jgi:asparagine synthase (glutamine-hydrolysing)
MCGICGVIDWSGSDDASALVRRMTPTMTHRGPDDEGYLDGRSGALSLGMRRLSIIDLEGGHQPIFTEDGQIAVVLNGEIYNFRELRKQLEDRGHTFRTRSDSEVVAHAYEEWGTDCVERLEGMFAIAVWDGRKERRGKGQGEGVSERLFLARDRLGIKPLYYYAQSASVQSPKSNVQSLDHGTGTWTLDVGHGTKFLFASEVRTLLASGVVPRRLSAAAVESYLLFGSVSEPMTLVDGILSLPPGHRLKIELDHPFAALRPERYWNIAEMGSGDGEKRRREDNGRENGHPVKDRTSTVQHVRGLLEESVRKHLIADVPVGVFLSSGIDSTSLAALASREVSEVNTFTVAFPEAEFSEAAIARRTAEKFGTTHREVMLNGEEMLARLVDAVSALDQPTMDGINTYFVSWSARQAGLKVALSGLGGDEVFGGYATFSRTTRYQRMATASSRMPAGVRSAMASVAGSAGRRFVHQDAARKVAALWERPQSLPDAFYFGRALFTPTQVSTLMRSSTDHRPLWWQWLADSAAEAGKLDSFAAVTCMEARSYLVNTLLRDTDSMSMAHSLEVRVPFLDHPLVEFVTQLPAEVKLSRGTPKALLVSALKDLLPSEVVNQTKRGFTFPWAAWLRGPLKRQLDSGFSEISPRLSELMSSQEIRGVWRSYLEGRTSWSRPWSLYVLNEWVKKHLD